MIHLAQIPKDLACFTLLYTSLIRGGAHLRGLDVQRRRLEPTQRERSLGPHRGGPLYRQGPLSILVSWRGSKTTPRPLQSRNKYLKWLPCPDRKRGESSSGEHSPVPRSHTSGELRGASSTTSTKPLAHKIDRAILEP